MADSSTDHPACLKRLFGSPRRPELDVDLARLHTLGLAMVGQTTLSGVQRKLSLGWSGDRQTLQVAVERGRFILKPQSNSFPHLPENEWLTMNLAALCGITTPPNGLITLRGGSIASIIRRFDRQEDGGKLRQEDFCQLSSRLPKEKYSGSSELCAKIVKRYASQPLIETLKLFRLLVFSWWVGNGDLHLKNLSLLANPSGQHLLSPAYDLLSTALVLPGDQLALPVQGRRDRLDGKTWMRFAEQIGVGAKAAARILSEQGSRLGPALERIETAPLPGDQREAYQEILRERTQSLSLV